MDVYSSLRGQRFVWDSDKARLNRENHQGLTFETACEAFFDRFGTYVDASANGEQRMALIGMTIDFVLLIVVHVEVHGDTIRSFQREPLNEKRRKLMRTAAERMRERLGKPNVMTAISLRVPEHVLDDLKEIAPMLGFSGYQSLLKAYISVGLRKDLEKLEGSNVSVLTESLRKRGVPEADIAAAIKEAGLKTA